MIDRLDVAVLIPCYNEALTVAEVVEGFRAALPRAPVYVFDNGSADQTRSRALAAGAIVRDVRLRGKGNVVRRMFADVDADIYVLVDGDATYDAASARKLVDKLIAERLDMVVGVRRHEERAAYRPGHQRGNRLLTAAMRRVFGGTFSDMLSGYRVFSRRFVKSFPSMSRGFEIETELTIHALELRMPCGEADTPYSARPAGSESKLRTYSDGARIARTIMKLFAVERPFAFYGAIAVALFALAVGLGVPLFITYAQTGLVPRFPTAILSTGLALLGAMSFTAGLILETVTIGRREIKRLFYLSMGAPAD